MPRNDDYIIPGAKSIDYSNVDEVEGYSLYLIKLYEREGGLKLPRKVTPLMRIIEHELRIWCDTVKQLLPVSSLAFIAALIPAYDLTYRIVYREAPARDFIRNIRISAVQRWATGEKTVSSAMIAKILRDEIHSRDLAKLDTKYVLYFFGLIEDWVRELQCTGTFADVTKAETYTRLKLIMNEELFAEYGTRGAEKDKIRWVENYFMTELDTIDTPTLRVYMEFIMAYSEMISLSTEEYIVTYISLLTELNCRQDLNRYIRLALTIDLSLKECEMKAIC